MSTYANRGMELESLIVASCNGYKSRGTYFIDKIPTPWKVTYDKRRNKVIRAYPEEKSTVDFVGHDKTGRYICFDAKQTNQKSLPFSMVKKHQTDHLIRTWRNGGAAFFVVYFKSLGEFYRIDIKQYMDYKREADRKGIPIKYFQENCKLLKRKYGMLEFMEDI